MNSQKSRIKLFLMMLALAFSLAGADALAANITSAIAQAEPSVLARVAYLERWQRRFTLASTFDYVQAHVARYSSLWV